MADEINRSDDVDVKCTVKRVSRVDLHDIGKIMLAFADEFLILVLIVYILYRIFW